MSDLRLFILALSLLTSLIAWPKNDGPVIRDVVVDPAISRRCQDLIEEREHKIFMKQKLTSLIHRNEKLLSELPENKEMVKAKLGQTLITSKQELQLTIIQIEAMEEKIVRKGCPGINL